VELIYLGRRFDKKAVHQRQCPDVQQTVWALAGARWRAISQHCVREERQDPYRSVGHYLVESIRAGIDNISMAGHDQHSVRVRVWKIPKRHQPLVFVCPFVIEGTHLDEGLDLIAIVHSKEIAERWVASLLRINCHYPIEPEIHAVAKDRDS